MGLTEGFAFYNAERPHQPILEADRCGARRPSRPAPTPVGFPLTLSGSVSAGP